MKCKKCQLVEMLVKSVNKDTIEYICKKCGAVEKATRNNSGE
jgi:hypothetical protein